MYPSIGNKELTSVPCHTHIPCVICTVPCTIILGFLSIIDWDKQFQAPFRKALAV